MTNLYTYNLNQEGVRVVDDDDFIDDSSSAHMVYVSGYTILVKGYTVAVSSYTNGII